MIFGIKTLHFILMMFCALLAGVSGAIIVLLVRHAAARKTKTAENDRPHSRVAQRAMPVSNWQKTARDEQLYNGR